MQHPEIQIIVSMGDKRYPEYDMLGAVAPCAALIITHLFVVSSRQRSENQEFNGRRRCEKSIIDKRKCRDQTWVHKCMSTNIDNIENIRL